MVCADVGGTTVKSALISVGRVRIPQSYKIKKFSCVQTRSGSGFDGVRESVLRAIENVMTEDAADIVAIATAGEVNWDDGTVLRATSSLPGFEGYAFSKDMATALKRRTVVINDACAAAVCEHYFSNRRAESTFVLTLGTGLGSALVTDGKINGDCVKDLELGHRLFVENGYECRCGKKGCLEQYLSATAIKRDAGTCTVKEALTNTGDDKCVQAKSNFLSALNYALNMIKKEFSPAEILIGGGLAEMRQLWLEDFYNEYGHRDVKAARLGNKAGLLGAAYAALNGSFKGQRKGERSQENV